MEDMSPKTIYVVRHGEGIHNVGALSSLGAGMDDIRYADSPLTARGEGQADAIAARIADINPDLIVSSPMTRALQTCLRACHKLGGERKVVIHKGLTERLGWACDVGSPASVLKEKFPGVDFGGLEEVWWWRQGEGEGSVAESVEKLANGKVGDGDGGVEPEVDLMARVDDVKRWIIEREERTVVVFAHAVLLSRLLADGKDMGPWLENCEIVKVVL